MQGCMAGSHLRWSVYENMVNNVWPQCSEQERRNIWLFMRRDLGSHWRPEDWNGFDLANAHGEGEWCEDIFDTTPWMYFRQVLARFDPENQYAVEMRCENENMYIALKKVTNPATIIKLPIPPRTEKGETWTSTTTTVIVRAYKWQDKYHVDWERYCNTKKIIKAENLEIPDDGIM